MSKYTDNLKELILDEANRRYKKGYTLKYENRVGTIIGDIYWADGSDCPSVLTDLDPDKHNEFLPLFIDGEWTEIVIDEKTENIKSSFITYFDGCFNMEPHELSRPNTYSMGVCKLDYDVEKNILTVHLRRPGLLIGKGGRTINDLKKWLECDIEIVEVKKF